MQNSASLYTFIHKNKLDPSKNMNELCHELAFGVFTGVFTVLYKVFYIVFYGVL